MNELPQPERQLSPIVPTDPYASFPSCNPYEGFPTTAHAVGETPEFIKTSLGELMSVLANKSFVDISQRAIEAIGDPEARPKVCFSESIAETRSMLTNVVAYLDKGHFDKAARALSSATYSMFTLGHILDQESGGEFGRKLGDLFDPKEVAGE